MSDAFLSQFSFKGRTVCVTGAASGIGEATARLFVDLGATVWAGDRNEKGLENLARDCGAAIRPVVYDQAEIASIERLAATIGPVDVLANNAGILLYEPILDLKWEDLDRVLSINLRGAIALTRLVGADMVKRRKGVIVHTSSQLVGNGAEFRAIYTAAKAGISQFVKTAALEWGRHGVRVNAVAPGRTLTPINRHLLTRPEDLGPAVARIPLGRLGEPKDQANAIIFLASDASSYVTGHTLYIDGGWILP